MASLIIGTLSIVLALALDGFEFVLAIPVIICGIPIIVEAAKGLVLEHDITADILVSVAMVAAVCIGEYFAAAEVAVIMCLGELLEESTIDHARSGIRRIVDMVPPEAWVLRDGTAVRCGLDEVRIGDTVRIKPGESIPVDGIVVAGESYIDRSLLNGEPVPVPVSVGGEVSSGTSNMLGAIDVEVTAVGSESTIGRITDLLNNADAGKSRIARLADRVAKYIVAGAFTMAVLAFLFTGDIIRSVTVLVVFCPCALVLSTPTAIMGATSNLSKRGILVKDGGAIERMAAVDTILMDKTGTITTGIVEMSGLTVTGGDLDRDTVMRMAASVENLSEHPLAKAVVDGYGGTLSQVTDFGYRPGYGVSGTVEGHEVCIGNRAMMDGCCDSGFGDASAESSAWESRGCTVSYISVDRRCVGFFGLTDTLKEGSPASIGNLNGMGLNTIMLTGDSERPAMEVCRLTGVSDVVWECMPDTKLRVVRNMESEHRICMVGDGINDAPSLKRASVGIAMGRNGKSLAIEAADIVFLEDDVSKLPGLCRLSRRTLTTIKAGMAFSMTVNVIGVVLAVCGLMGPIVGALVHNVGSLLVIGSAAMLLHYDAWGDRKVPASVEPVPS